MKEFRISSELKPYIIKILILRDIPYIINESTIQVPISGNKFHKIVQRARCEKLTEETGVLYITKPESESIASTILMNHAKTTTAIILDNEKYN